MLFFRAFSLPVSIIIKLNNINSPTYNGNQVYNWTFFTYVCEGRGEEDNQLRTPKGYKPWETNLKIFFTSSFSLFNKYCDLRWYFICVCVFIVKLMHYETHICKVIPWTLTSDDKNIVWNNILWSVFTSL